MSSKIIQSLIQIADESPADVALVTENEKVTYKTLLHRVYEVADWFQHSQINCIAVCVENSFAWVVIDLACMMSSVTHITLPRFPSDKQLRDILNIAKVDIIISDNVKQFVQPGTEFTSCVKILELETLRPVVSTHANVTNSRDNRITFIPATADQLKVLRIHQQLLDKVVTNLQEHMQTYLVEENDHRIPCAVQKR